MNKKQFQRTIKFINISMLFWAVIALNALINGETKAAILLTPIFAINYFWKRSVIIKFGKSTASKISSSPTDSDILQSYINLVSNNSLNGEMVIDSAKLPASPDVIKTLIKRQFDSVSEPRLKEALKILYVELGSFTPDPKSSEMRNAILNIAKDPNLKFLSRQISDLPAYELTPSMLLEQKALLAETKSW